MPRDADPADVVRRTKLVVDDPELSPENRRRLAKVAELYAELRALMIELQNQGFRATCQISIGYDNPSRGAPT